MDALRPAWIAMLLSLLCMSPKALSGEKPAERLVAAVWKQLGASGAREVVIEPDREKLKARGLTMEQLRGAVRGRRFVSGEWTIEVNESTFDLANLAKLTVRELQAPPFTVTLRDGREVLITPDPQRIGHYVVTGEYFEKVVRERLADYSGNTPGKVRVMDMIKVPGTVIPHATERGTMVHLSMGEPLETFAKVEVRGKPQSPPTGTAERLGR